MNTKLTPRNKMTGFAMRGGIDLTDIDKRPNSNYWKVSARGAEQAIYKVIPEGADSYLKKFLAPLWNGDNTWKEICEQTEKVLEWLRNNQENVEEILRIAAKYTEGELDELNPLLVQCNTDPAHIRYGTDDADWKDEMQTRESNRPF